MNRCISEYGSDCYTDCRPCEIEGAEEHFDDEMGYDLCGEKVIGYNLTDTKEINNKADKLGQEQVQEHIADYVDILMLITTQIKLLSQLVKMGCTTGSGALMQKKMNMDVPWNTKDLS